MAYETIHVKSYSGYRVNERPAAFAFRERRWEILEIIDRWYEGGIDASRPEISYFKIKTTEGYVRFQPIILLWIN